MATKKDSAKASKPKVKAKAKGAAKPRPVKAKKKAEAKPTPVKAKKQAAAKPAPVKTKKQAMEKPRSAAPTKKPKSAVPATPAVKKKKENEIVINSRYDEIREDLTRQKMRLLVEAGLSGNGELNTEEALPDLGDRASVESDQTFSLRLLERGQNLTKKIEEALGRIQDGTFGICEVCGGEIAFRRLKARPVTTLCIDCKTEQENEEKAKG
jgi:DnaK suppressor protein